MVCCSWIVRLYKADDGASLREKRCWTYCTSTCLMQLFRSVELLIVKLAVQHISGMHLKKQIKIYRQMETEEQTLAFSAMVDFNQQWSRPAAL